MGWPSFLGYFYFLLFQGVRINLQSFIFRSLKTQDTPSASPQCVLQLNLLCEATGLSSAPAWCLLGRCPVLTWCKIVHFLFSSLAAEAMGQTKWGTPLPRLFQILVLTCLLYFSGKQLGWIHCFRTQRKEMMFSVLPSSVVLPTGRELPNISVHFTDEKTGPRD